MRNPVTPAMASIGAMVLRSLPWNGHAADPQHLARLLYGKMEEQRLLEERSFATKRHEARAAANTPWNTPARGERPEDGQAAG